MKTNTLTLALLLAFIGVVNAQDLYVEPNSYVFVQDEVIFVNDDIRLQAASSYIYLREGAQLVQNTDNAYNSDRGSLSVYQDQTVGIHEYNYWNSPVGLNPNGATGANTASDMSLLFDPC